MRLLLTGILFSVLLQTGLRAQNPYAAAERMRFARLSLEMGEASTTLLEAEQLLALPQDSLLNTDSLHFIAARAAYQLHLRDSAMLHFSLISPEAGSIRRWADASLGWKAFHLRDSVDLQGHLSALREENDRMTDFGSLIEMAEALHRLDTVSYRNLRSERNVRDLYVRQALNQMDAQVLDYAEHKPKKPAVAGLLSAAVPGAGKCYIGQWGAGAITLLSHAAIGVQAWEGYHRDGFRSPQFIAMSSLLLLSYSVNIYGTVIQTKRYNVTLVSDFQRGVGVEVDLAFDRLLR
jgi:hypothetical protein